LRFAVEDLARRRKRAFKAMEREGQTTRLPDLRRAQHTSSRTVPGKRLGVEREAHGLTPVTARSIRPIWHRPPSPRSRRGPRTSPLRFLVPDRRVHERSKKQASPTTVRAEDLPGPL
jgi:hypothetical protein